MRRREQYRALFFLFFFKFASQYRYALDALPPFHSTVSSAEPSRSGDPRLPHISLLLLSAALPRVSRKRKILYDKSFDITAMLKLPKSRHRELVVRWAFGRFPPLRTTLLEQKFGTEVGSAEGALIKILPERSRNVEKESRTAVYQLLFFTFDDMEQGVMWQKSRKATPSQGSRVLLKGFWNIWLKKSNSRHPSFLGSDMEHRFTDRYINNFKVQYSSYLTITGVPGSLLNNFFQFSKLGKAQSINVPEILSFCPTIAKVRDSSNHVHSRKASLCGPPKSSWRLLLALAYHWSIIHSWPFHGLLLRVQIRPVCECELRAESSRKDARMNSTWA